ncbi:zinc-dependent peptidase [Pararhodonellum marinum]|uniref:zinc-dependent peptidase n=1 Tax=Pararhodonellum marinum TaxID=2755358 RepID=UPI001E382F5D|nr:zinc-dependent peptidase [Pararhodonellum marinum]
MNIHRVNRNFLFELYHWILVKLGVRKLQEEEIQILHQHVPYFKGLSPAHQKEFKERLIYFLWTKQFIPRGNIQQVSTEMRILIGAVAVKVTFGLEGVSLKHFNKILIYPDDYYSTINETYHQGEVNPRLGVIVISWRNFLRGHLDTRDGVNLGIHEIAHALKLENRIHYNGESDFFHPKAWQEYVSLATKEIEKIRSGEYTILRQSAGKNEHEFFAVALEAFFEIPDRLLAYNAELYKGIVLLLQQDPLKLSDYWKQKDTELK